MGERILDAGGKFFKRFIFGNISNFLENVFQSNYINVVNYEGIIN